MKQLSKLSQRRAIREAVIENQVISAQQLLHAAVRFMKRGTNILSERTRSNMEQSERHIATLREYHRANYDK